MLLNNGVSMTEKRDTNKEQAIMEAAEIEFLEKGLAQAKTTDIARRAGVTHAMLHYYFRTKENLFDQVFERKVKLLATSFAMIGEQDIPFLEKIRRGVETHFDFVAAHPGLPFFVMREILWNPDRQELCKRVVLPVMENVIHKLTVGMETERKKGNIIPVDPVNLMLNIVSLNVFVFLAPSLMGMLAEQGGRDYQSFLQERKEQNVQLILKGLQPLS